MTLTNVFGNSRKFIKCHGKNERLSHVTFEQAQNCSLWNSLLEREVMSRTPPSLINCIIIYTNTVTYIIACTNIVTCIITCTNIVAYMVVYTNIVVYIIACINIVSCIITYTNVVAYIMFALT
jgi:hypothetical protein